MSALQDLIDVLRPGASATLVWTNPLGGQTYRLDDPDGSTHFLKVAPLTVPASHLPAAEADRLRWIGDRFPVPRVVGAGSTDGLSWMLTARVPGVPASDPGWNSDPALLATRLGRAVRTFHDRLVDGVSSCPWSWRVDHRVTHGRGLDEARAMARTAPAERDLVVAHGDLCAPNILLHPDLTLAGFTDVGKLGVAARAADLGCCQWSFEFNDMSEQVPAFLDAYGYTGDPAEVQWYRDFYTVV